MTTFFWSLPPFTGLVEVGLVLFMAVGIVSVISVGLVELWQRYCSRP